MNSTSREAKATIGGNVIEGDMAMLNFSPPDSQGETLMTKNE